MASSDVRWRQRFANFEKALGRFAESVQINTTDRLAQEGVIQRFEYTFELAWKCLQDLFQERGLPEIRGPKPVLQQALQDGLIHDGLQWMEMLKARNAATHLYDEAVFLEIYAKARRDFLPLLQQLQHTLRAL
ncbi:MAG: nucleotidyltransferase substrate binding protein [Deltaproteobacteria bacterium]|nr:nucleotidyltransferase substrate binding protein [Deltaproteobacteria bacterium]